jgi:ERCC4-related helicase
VKGSPRPASADAIHGNKSQNQRERVLAAFRSGKIRTVLVATDIAARGIDVDGISHVVNFDLPERPGELRPPHRPHRARRRRRHRDLVLRRTRSAVPARHRRPSRGRDVAIRLTARTDQLPPQERGPADDRLGTAPSELPALIFSEHDPVRVML